MRIGAENKSMGSEDASMEDETKVYSESVGPLAASAEQTGACSSSDARVRLARTLTAKKDTSDDANAGVNADDVAVHPGRCPARDSSIPPTRPLAATSCTPLRKRPVSVPPVPPQKERPLLYSLFTALALLAVILALVIPTLLIEVEEAGWGTSNVENAAFVSLVHRHDNEKNAPSDALLPPPDLRPSPADALSSSEAQTPPAGSPGRLSDARAKDLSEDAGGAFSAGPRWYCFTLAAYSADFVASNRQNRNGERLFRCGTRVVDLRTETRPEVLAACRQTTADPLSDAALQTSPGMGRKGAREAESGSVGLPLSALRVVLVGEEREWHLRNRRNAAAQDIPLERLNDDYCDCLDGSDELLTNACSMAGAGMPLAGARWRPYLLSNRRTRLYREQLEDRVRGELAAPPEVDPKNISAFVEARALALRSIELGGPVLPVRCSSDPTMLLAPSVLADGIVDCCDGSDEGLRVDGEKNEGAPVRERREVEEAWAARREGIAAAYLPAHFAERTEKPSPLPSARRQPPPPIIGDKPDVGKGDRRSFKGQNSPYWDRLHPYYTSAAAVLVDKGYTSLFTCSDLNRLRLEKAELILHSVEQGHRIQKARVLAGWDALGRFLVGNRSNTMDRLNSSMMEIQELSRQIQNRMAAKRTSDPIEAGVPVGHLERYSTLENDLKYLKQDYLYLDTILTQKVFGKHYEYYPLYGKKLRINASEVVRSDHSNSPVEQRDAASRRVRAEEIYKPTTPLESRRHPHIDNITFVELAFTSSRDLLAAQSMALKDKDRSAAAVRNLGSSKEEGSQRDVFEQTQSGELPTHLLFFLGHWQPFSMKGVGAHMGLVDLAGDVDLRRRALVRPFSTLHRGGGRLQWPTRSPDRTRFFEIEKEDEESGKQRILSAGKGNAQKKIVIPLLRHTNGPDCVAVHVYKGGDLRCEVDPPLNVRPNPEDDKARESNTDVGYHGRQPHNLLYEFQSALVSFVCHPSDELLVWAFNGKCQQEIIVGTPSACTQWVVSEARKKVSLFKEVAKQYKLGR